MGTRHVGLAPRSGLDIRLLSLWGDLDAAAVVLRPAAPGDEHEVAEVHVRSWQVAYRGLLSDEYLDALVPANRGARYTFGENSPDRPYTTVAVEDDRISGFATVGPCRDPDKSTAGELYAIYVHPDRRNLGFGRILIQEARQRLTERGFAEAVLWVLVGNVRAERFYQVDGWRADGQCRSQEVHGIEVDEVRYDRSLS